MDKYPVGLAPALACSLGVPQEMAGPVAFAMGIGSVMGSIAEWAPSVLAVAIPCTLAVQLYRSARNVVPARVEILARAAVFALEEELAVVIEEEPAGPIAQVPAVPAGPPPPAAVMPLVFGFPAVALPPMPAVAPVAPGGGGVPPPPPPPVAGAPPPWQGQPANNTQPRDRALGPYWRELVQRAKAKFDTMPEADSPAQRAVVRKWMYGQCVEHEVRPTHVHANLDICVMIAFIPSRYQVTAKQIEGTEVADRRKEEATREWRQAPWWMRWMPLTFRASMRR